MLMFFWQVGQPLQAATIYWDSDATASGNNSTTGIGLGGSGTWNTSSLNWWDGTNPDSAWPNAGAPGDQAVFWGTAGTVTAGQKAKLTFDAFEADATKAKLAQVTCY